MMGAAKGVLIAVSFEVLYNDGRYYWCSIVKANTGQKAFSTVGGRGLYDIFAYFPKVRNMGTI